MTTGVAACPCHFPITLPIVVSALGGMGLGGLIAANIGLIYGVGAVYFVIALGLSIYLLNRRSASASTLGELPLADRTHSSAQMRRAQIAPRE